MFQIIGLILILDIPWVNTKSSFQTMILFIMKKTASPYVKNSKHMSKLYYILH